MPRVVGVPCPVCKVEITTSMPVEGRSPNGKFAVTMCLVCWECKVYYDGKKWLPLYPAKAKKR